MDKSLKTLAMLGIIILFLGINIGMIFLCRYFSFTINESMGLTMTTIIVDMALIGLFTRQAD